MAEYNSSTESDFHVEGEIPSHGNGDGNTTNWWSYESLTIGEAAAFRHEMHPKFAFSKRCGPLQQALLFSTIQRLIGAVMTGSIRTIEHYDPSNKTEITHDTKVITKDVLIFLGRISGQQETGSQQTASDKELLETERSTMLRLIIGMAIDAYKYVPGKPRNSATGNKNGSIKAALENLGLSADEKTISKYLKEAAELYPDARPRKT